MSFWIVRAGTLLKETNSVRIENKQRLQIIVLLAGAANSATHWSEMHTMASDSEPLHDLVLLLIPFSGQVQTAA